MSWLWLWGCARQVPPPAVVVGPVEIPAEVPVVSEPVRPEASVLIWFSTDPVPTTLQLDCDATRWWSQIIEGKAVFSEVPVGVPCSVFPKGPLVAAAPFVGVYAGQEWVCHIEGTVMTCKRI